VIISFYPYTIAAGGTGYIFIVFALFWIIASLLKKASEASKRTTTGTARLRKPPESRPGMGPRLPTVSDFLRRIQEMSEQAEEQGPSEVTDAEKAVPRTLVPPPTPQRPTFPQRRVPHRTSLRQPGVRRAETRQELYKPGHAAAFDISTKPIVAPGVQPQGFTVAAPSPQPVPDAYTLKAAVQPQITRILGQDISASGMRKGVILAEVLGRPVALRRRRR
jgi:hypothetical protein